MENPPSEPPNRGGRIIKFGPERPQAIREGRMNISSLNAHAQREGKKLDQKMKLIREQANEDFKDAGQLGDYVDQALSGLHEATKQKTQAILKEGIAGIEQEMYGSPEVPKKKGLWEKIQNLGERVEKFLEK